ncbi:MAG: DUF2141 domain-containing protein [Myxococcota bacterium]
MTQEPTMTRQCGASASLLLTLALAWCWPVVADAEEPAPPVKDDALRIEVLNIRSDRGQIGCSLFTKADGFPSDAKNAASMTFVKPKGRKATCVFKKVKPGTYAVSVLHDLDGDGELATSLVGRPKEPWGVSNDAPPQRFGPPEFKAASFSATGAAQTLRIKLRE